MGRGRPGLGTLAPVPLSVVCFRAHPPGLDNEAALETLNARLMEAVNATGEIFLSHTKLNGRYTLRLAIGNMHTQDTTCRPRLGTAAILPGFFAKIVC